VTFHTPLIYISHRLITAGVPQNNLNETKQHRVVRTQNLHHDGCPFCTMCPEIDYAAICRENGSGTRSLRSPRSITAERGTQWGSLSQSTIRVIRPKT